MDRLKNRLITGLIVVFCSLGLSQPRELHILYSQNTNGVLVNCQCPSAPLGGLEKRATFIKGWLKTHPNTLLFDSGDFMSFDGDENSDARMIKAMEALTYSAVNLGDQEFSNGLDFLKTNINQTSIPWIASNLKQTRKDRLSIPPYRLLESGGLKVLVLGVLDKESYDFFDRIYGDFQMEVLDPAEAIGAVYQTMTKNTKVDLVLLLSNLGYDQDAALAGELTFLDIIIGGHSQHQFEDPVKIENAIITQSGKNGQYVGHLELRFDGGKLLGHSGELIPMDLSIPDDETMLELITE
ncbi:MAG: hypothetical protein H8E18_02295 [FCB group bacterium]|nr:hypothetical protein [FCB group bacterium]